MVFVSRDGVLGRSVLGYKHPHIISTFISIRLWSMKFNSLHKWNYLILILRMLYSIVCKVAESVLKQRPLVQCQVFSHPVYPHIPVQPWNSSVFNVYA
jgi:hypothetical protein